MLHISSSAPSLHRGCPRRSLKACVNFLPWALTKAKPIEPEPEPESESQSESESESDSLLTQLISSKHQPDRTEQNRTERENYCLSLSSLPPSLFLPLEKSQTATERALDFAVITSSSSSSSSSPFENSKAVKQLCVGLIRVFAIAKLDRLRGDRYGTSDDQDYYSSSYRHSRGPSRFSDAPVNHHHQQQHNNSRRRPFESPPRRSPAGDGFRPAGGGGGGGGTLGPVSGQKRGFPFSGRGGSPPDRFDRGSFAKLFVGSVPRTATEEDIRPLFEEHGDVIEVALIRDRKTGQQQGCCFIKYGSSEEADRAIRALHNQHTLPGGIGPIQVRYADGERERLGAVEYKLFVGSMNKQATEKEIEEIFSQYGRVEDVYLMRDDLKQSRGCGFVKYSHREMALAAINALNGCYTMRGCDQPLTVRFADPKRPRPGDSRGGSAFGGPGFGPRFQGPGPRPGPYFGEPMRDRIPPNAWQPMSPPNLGPSSTGNIHGFRGQFHPRSGDMTLPVNLGGHGGPADSLLLAVSSSSTLQQSFSQSLAPVGQQLSPLQKPIESPQQLPPSFQLHPQTPASYSQVQPPPLASLQQPGQTQLPYSSGQTAISQPLPSQQLLVSNGQLPISQPQVQNSMASATTLQSPPTINLQPLPAAPVQQQQQLQPLQQSPSQLAQMLSQQKQALQASFQSSRQAFSQLQQQLQLMQPSNQGGVLQQGSQDTKQQQWGGTAAQAVTSLPATTASADVPSSTSAAPAVPVKCPWTEHISPDKYKYYYNSITGESKWEKPEELILYEQQQQLQHKATVLQHQSQSLPQRPTAQQVSQAPQIQLQTQFQMQAQQQFQQPSLSSTASGILGHQNIQGYTQLQGVGSSGQQAAQEWMWKNNQAG